MRLLFVSGVTAGGSGRSQRELVKRLVALGHEVTMLVDDGRPARFTRWRSAHLADLAARCQRVPGSGFARWLEARPGRRTGTAHLDEVEMRTAVVPQNAARRVIAEFEPDVVVCNSVERLTWRRVHRLCESHRIPTVLYVREVNSLAHLLHGEHPTVLVANAQSLQAALEERGFDCAFIPSVTDVERTRTTSSRRVVLFVNPLPTHGIDLLWQLADRLPDIPFVVQDSRPPDEESIVSVRAQASSRANVEYRPLAAPGPSLYADAKILLVPHQIDNRPRIIAEAQANGIPVIASDFGGLREAAGDGAVFVQPSDVGAWVRELGALWSDEPRYQSLADAARVHSQRPEMDPDAVVAAFETLIAEALARRADPPAR